MIIEIPFNENVFRRQCTLHFEVSYRDKIEKLNTLVLFVAIGFLVCIPLIFLNSFQILEIPIVLFLALALYIVVKQKLAYKKLENDYYQNIKIHIKDARTINRIDIVECNEKYIRWENDKVNLRFNWEAIPNISIVDTVIFFTIGLQPILMLSKEEIGKENYQTLINILTTKSLI